MRSRRYPKTLDQLTIFHPMPLTPQWRSMPTEVREQTLRLLARFLRSHRRAQLAERHAVKVVCDE